VRKLRDKNAPDGVPGLLRRLGRGPR
jgi:hypothetical protein